MRKFLAILFSVVVTVGAITVLGASVSDPYEFDGDVITNPFWWLYTEEASETPTEPVTVEANWVQVGEDDSFTYYYDQANMTVNEVVSVQQPGWSPEIGIYFNVPAGMTSVSVNGNTENVATIDGAGAIVYLSALTQDVNTVVATYGDNQTATVSFKKVEKEAPTEKPTEAPTPAPVELKITSQPAAVTAEVGETVSFSVEAEGEGLTYQWQVFNASGVWANTSVSGNKTNTISFVIPATYKTKQYRCIVSDENGNSVTSDVAMLTVREEEVSSIKITKQPEDLTAPAGTTAKFSVSATGNGLKYQWQTSSNGNTWNNTSVSGNSTDEISFVIPITYTVKYYRVVITDDEGNRVVSDSAKLTVGEGSLAITSQPQDVTAPIGSTVKFGVVATGSGLKYQWQTSSDGNKWNNTSVSGNQTNEISFTIPATYTVKYYRVIVTDSVGYSVTSEAAKLTVGSGLEIVSQPLSITVKAGETATFSVKASSDDATYQWQVFNAAGAWANTSIAGNKTDTISFSVPSSYTTKQYRCIVTRGSESVISDVATLTVEK